MALTSTRINEIRDELERFYPLSREDREELLSMALAQANQLEGGSAPAAEAEAAAETVVKKSRGKLAAAAVTDPAPADDTTA